LSTQYKHRGIEANIVAVDNISTFSFCCICDLVEFHGIALMLLAVPMNRWGYGVMRAVVFLLRFLRNMDWNLNVY
jgi:hypothetical protein